MSIETREISVIGKEDCGIIDITGMITKEVNTSKIRGVMYNTIIRYLE